MIGLNGRDIFRKGPFKPDIGVYMAICHMMNYLPNSPSLWSIRRIELQIIKIFYQIFESLWKLFNSCNPLRSEEHTSELQSRENLVCRLLLEKKKKNQQFNQ